MSTITRQRPPFPSGWSSIAISPSNLTLANTLPIGQSFLWHRHQLSPPQTSAPPVEHAQPTEEFSRALNDPPRVVCLRQTDTSVYYTALYPDHEWDETDVRDGVTHRWLKDYFQLDRYPSLEKLYAEWKDRDPGMFGRLDTDYQNLPLGQGGRARGVRLLRQDPWECLIAFITSTNNHIPRIAGLMHRLGTHFSPPLLTLADPATMGIIDFDSKPPLLGNGDLDSSTTYHPFPGAHLLPQNLEPTLREIGFGYRAGFIESSLATLHEEFGANPGDVDGGLQAWRGGDVDDVREKLIGLKGVGRKVADCVMLMCLDQPHLIPIDTHLSAIAARHPLFPSRLKNKPMSKALYDEVQEFLLDKWGPMGGWAQAVMFALELPETTVRQGAKVTGTPKGTPVKGRIKTDPAEAAEELVKMEEQGWRTPSKAGIASSASTSSRPGSAVKRKVSTPVRAQGAKQEDANVDVFSPDAGSMAGLPAGYGSKRTRSAARIELQRKVSGVSVLADQVGALEFDNPEVVERAADAE